MASIRNTRRQRLLSVSAPADLDVMNELGLLGEMNGELEKGTLTFSQLVWMNLVALTAGKINILRRIKLPLRRTIRIIYTIIIYRHNSI